MKRRIAGACKDEVVKRKLVSQRLVALFFAGVLLFNFPLLDLWDRDVYWLNIPLSYLALFAIWALLIGVLAWQLERQAD